MYPSEKNSATLPATDLEPGVGRGRAGPGYVIALIAWFQHYRMVRSTAKSSTFDSTPLLEARVHLHSPETRFPPGWMKRSAKHTVCAKAQEAGSVKNH